MDQNSQSESDDKFYVESDVPRRTTVHRVLEAVKENRDQLHQPFHHHRIQRAGSDTTNAESEPVPDRGNDS